MNRFFATAFLFAAVILTQVSAAYAGLCPMCRKALEESGNRGLIEGFYWSIILIAGMPLVIVGIIIAKVFSSRKKQNR